MAGQKHMGIYFHVAFGIILVKTYPKETKMVSSKQVQE
jgi:hypothetical protein